MANELDGKVAIITGAARGLGAAAAELFVEEGARVVIADLRDEEGAALAEKLGSAARYLRTDVADRDAVQALVDYAVSEFGRLDVMVNNAGITDAGPDRLLDASFDRFDAIMAVNIHGTMLGTQIAARHMAANGGGSVINISSISGIHAGFGFFSYRASKAAVVNLTKTAACELGEHLVRVNCICPGNIPSEMGAFAHTDGLVDDKAARIKQAVNDTRMNWQPLKRQGNPRDIANATMFLASDRSAQMTGQIIAVDGGATAGDPRSQIADILQARAAAEAEF
jgi:NAD(P)-dependent dehydrogenase (short-subunit alcohol dehydrogenase family)